MMTSEYTSADYGYDELNGRGMLTWNQNENARDGVICTLIYRGDWLGLLGAPDAQTEFEEFHIDEPSWVFV